MTKTKTVLTFEQLDALLTRKGKPPSAFGFGSRAISSPAANDLSRMARVHLAIYAKAQQHSRSIDLIMHRKSGVVRFLKIATVSSIDSGDTLYRVIGFGKGGGNFPSDHRRRHYAQWRPRAHRVTPYDGRKVKGQWLYRVRKDGTWSECVTPPHENALYPKCISPKRPSAWANNYDFTKRYPNYIERLKRFARALRREVHGTLDAQVQLLWGTQSLQADSTLPACGLHVCTPPRPAAEAKHLTVFIAMHDEYSRDFFRLRKTYTDRHCQFFATAMGRYEFGRMGGRCEYRWKCQADALVGIKEWLLGSLYIPGPDF